MLFFLILALDLISQGCPAHEEVLDADYIYGPALPKVDMGLSDEEISLQVVVAMKHLERLRFYCRDRQAHSLFVRWTIHNWANQGPFNLEAYAQTLSTASLPTHMEHHHDVSSSCSATCLSAHEEVTVVLSEAGPDKIAGTQTSEVVDTMTKVGKDTMTKVGRDTMTKVGRGWTVQASVDVERVGGQEEAQGCVSQARRVRGKGRWSRMGQLVNPDIVPLGHITGAGSVIVAAGAVKPVSAFWRDVKGRVAGEAGEGVRCECPELGLSQEVRCELASRRAPLCAMAADTNADQGEPIDAASAAEISALDFAAGAMTGGDEAEDVGLKRNREDGDAVAIKIEEPSRSKKRCRGEIAKIKTQDTLFHGHGKHLDDMRRNPTVTVEYMTDDENKGQDEEDILKVNDSVIKTFRYSYPHSRPHLQASPLSSTAPPSPPSDLLVI
jgi:hypothetical protein